MLSLERIEIIKDDLEDAYRNIRDASNEIDYLLEYFDIYGQPYERRVYEYIEDFQESCEDSMDDISRAQDLLIKEMKKRNKDKKQMDRLEHIFVLDYVEMDNNEEQFICEVSVEGSGELFIKTYETKDEIDRRLRKW